MRRVFILILLLLLAIACRPSTEVEERPLIEPDAVSLLQTNTPFPTNTSFPTATVTQTGTPFPTPIMLTAVSTSPPTNTPTNTATPLPTNTPTDTPTALPTNTPLPATPTAAFTSTPAATQPPPSNLPPIPSSYPPLDIVPTQPQGYLDKYRLVTFYGSPMGVGLGILGEHYREDVTRMLRNRSAEYQALSDRPVIPTYHMVVTVANQSPPDYRHHAPLGVVEEWIAVAEANGIAVILDIQPGRRDVLEEFNRIRYLLYKPHVHVAIDPEFVMNPEQVPLVNVGQLYAEQINQVQASLNGIGYEIGLNKVLILHQFKDSMLPDKQNIQPFPFVELVIDGDGFGPAGPKIRNYNQYANEPGFEYGGFKLFPDDGDVPVMDPEWVMSVLVPQPMIIIYQ